MKRITAPQASAAATRAKVRAAARAAADRPAGSHRTPAEVDEVLDLLLERVADLEG